MCLFLSVPDALAGDVVDLAATLIGRPYVWGAEGPNSFDCSGLTQYVYQEFGVELPRRAISQAKTGDPTKRLQRGDLLFFSTNTRKSVVTHVGLYEGGGVMIDASKRHGRVRRDDLSEDYWVERFMFARRVESLLFGGDPRDRQDDQIEDRPGQSRNKRRAAVRVIERIAGELFKLPRR